MGGGDLNMKKSWHPLLLKNQERVWLEEKKALEEKKKLDQLRKEKEEERQLQELQRLQEEQTGKKRQEKLEWMYATPATGNSQNQNDLEDYLLGKKRVDKALMADDNAKLGASHKNFIAVQNANTARDISAKIREDPLLAIKQQEQAAYQALMSNPLRLRELQERNGIKPKKDKKDKKEKKREKEEKKREKEERKRLRLDRRYRHENDSRSSSPYERRRSGSSYDRRRSASPYGRRRSPSVDAYSRSRRSRSRDRRPSPLPYDDYKHRSSRPYSPEPRRRDSRSPQFERGARGRDSSPDPTMNGHRRTPHYGGSKRSRSPSPRYNDEYDSRSKRYRTDRSPSSHPAPRQPQPRPLEKDAKTLAEERAARLAAMSSNASSMQEERQKRLVELLQKEKADLEREELERAKAAKSGGIGSFMSADYKKVYSGEGGLEDRIRRSRHALVADAD